MRFILTTFLSIWTSFVFGQSTDEQIEYPRDFKYVKHFIFSSSSDTFDCYGWTDHDRILILSIDSNFHSFYFTSNMVYRDSGRFSMLSQSCLVIKKINTFDTMDILENHKQIILVPRNSRQYFIKQYKDLKAFYKQLPKKDRKHKFKKFFLSRLGDDAFGYHRRSDYSKWILKVYYKKKEVN